MVEEKAVSLREFRLSPQDLDVLSQDQQAALAIISFAVSEINALARIYLFSSHKSTGVEAIDSAIKIQRNTVLRIWSSKVFEFSEFLSFQNKTGTTNDSRLKQFGKDALARLESIPFASGAVVARRIRNTAAFHYSFKSAKKNIAHLPPEREGALYFNRLRSNCFFPLGEELMFVANIFAASGAGEKQGEFIRASQEWLDWLMEATLWVDGVQDAFFRDILLPLFPGRSVSEKVYRVSDTLSSTVASLKVPVFLDSEAQ